jgi:hypothetical protein
MYQLRRTYAYLNPLKLRKRNLLALSLEIIGLSLNLYFKVAVELVKQNSKLLLK